MKINEDFLAQMREATMLLQSEGPMAATAAIQRALHGATETADTTQQSDWTRFLPQVPDLQDINTPHAHGTDAPSATKMRHGQRNPAGGKWASMSARQPVEDVDIIEPSPSDAEKAGKGRFISAACTNRAGTRSYKLYIPSGYKEDALPLVVMLHGCTQNPDDFAAGTGMNMLAEQHNCFVIYPAQAKESNVSQCWNWFQPGDQRRDQGEPSIIADMTREVSRTYKIDPSRVYVAGMSAGGAMAAVLAATYPELYAAVGIHSGLPYGVAHDMPSAFAAMKRHKSKGAMPKVPPKAPAALGKSVPAIVFHGDRDMTVHPVNGDQVLTQCVPMAGDKDARLETHKEEAPNGRPYTKTVVKNAQGDVVAEKWVVHGAGHAWAGGSNKGSYTDPKGPNASAEMLRFFLTHRQAG